MYAAGAVLKSVLDGIQDPELREDLHLDGKGPHTAESAHVVNWIGDGIEHFKASVSADPEAKPKPLGPTELLRGFYLSIARDGLKKTYEEANKLRPGRLPKLDCKEPVIIVGAGMSGLVAGYELKREGYEVIILEMSKRFGGRVKTLGRKEGFAEGLFADAGAMRLPQTADKDRPISETLHYLTDYYAVKKFNLKPIPFNNFSVNAVYNFYGEVTTIKDWKDGHFSKYWPGWNKKLKASGLDKKVTNIEKYYSLTVGIVIDLLRNRMKKIPAKNIKEQAKQWDMWMKNWGQFSFGGFIRSNVTAIKSLLNADYRDSFTAEEVLQLNELNKYLPWPEPAITAYTNVDYYLALDVSLGKWLMEEMAQWFSLHMHTLEGGLSALPNAFATQGGMEKNIVYNRCVTKVEYFWTSDKDKSVKVSGVSMKSGKDFCVTGRSVILTPPLHVIRGIRIVNGYKRTDTSPSTGGIDPRGPYPGIDPRGPYPGIDPRGPYPGIDPRGPGPKPYPGIGLKLPFPNDFPDAAIEKITKPFPKEFQKAIQNISYTPSTKVMLQYKKQFWNTGKNEKTDICAGYSGTNMPIGRLYYPTEEVMYKYKGTFDDASYVKEIDGVKYVIKPAPVREDQKGILMVYTWKSEALLWGALTKDMAIRLAVDQVDELHPGIDTKELFEVGSVEAWASDPTTLGGFAIPRPREYLSIMYLMQHPWRNVYFAGEGISLASGWIQGALGSGLRAAYQLFADDQPYPEKKRDPIKERLPVIDLRVQEMIKAAIFQYLKQTGLNFEIEDVLLDESTLEDFCRHSIHWESKTCSDKMVEVGGKTVKLSTYASQLNESALANNEKMVERLMNGRRSGTRAATNRIHTLEYDVTISAEANCELAINLRDSGAKVVRQAASVTSGAGIGALVGAVGGPIGMLVGAAIGAAVGTPVGATVATMGQSSVSERRIKAADIFKHLGGSKCVRRDDRVEKVVRIKRELAIPS